MFIEGFSKEIFCNVHPSGNKVSGVCLFFKQNIPIKCTQDLELSQETIVTEISLGQKKIFFVVVYRSANQSSEELNIFKESLQVIIGKSLTDGISLTFILLIYILFRRESPAINTFLEGALPGLGLSTAL